VGSFVTADFGQLVGRVNGQLVSRFVGQLEDCFVDMFTQPSSSAEHGMWHALYFP
jgi:hypothetical protein